MFSTPDVFQLPQMGFVSFRCDRAFRAQPFFDTRAALATEQVTIRAGGVTQRNFTTRVVGRYRGRTLHVTTVSADPVIALPFADYRTVTFTASTATEARALKATLTAQFVAGPVHRKGYPPGGACYVRRWRVSMSVSPY